MNVDAYLNKITICNYLLTVMLFLNLMTQAIQQCGSNIKYMLYRVKSTYIRILKPSA
jgi:hypothetical protein